MIEWLVDTFEIDPGFARGVQFFIAVLIVLALIAVFVWVLRRVTGSRFVGNRNRQPRIAIMDATALDARRRLILVRRDNIEHLILVGGPSDVVVEQNIVRGVPVGANYPRHAQNQSQRPAAAANEQDPAPRAPVSAVAYAENASEPAQPPHDIYDDETLQANYLEQTVNVTHKEPEAEHAAPKPAAPAEPAPRPAEAASRPQARPAPAAERRYSQSARNQAFAQEQAGASGSASTPAARQRPASGHSVSAPAAHKTTPAPAAHSSASYPDDNSQSDSGNAWLRPRGGAQAERAAQSRVETPKPAQKTATSPRGPLDVAAASMGRSNASPKSNDPISPSGMQRAGASVAAAGAAVAGLGRDQQVRPTPGRDYTRTGDAKSEPSSAPAAASQDHHRSEPRAASEHAAAPQRRNLTPPSSGPAAKAASLFTRQDETATTPKTSPEVKAPTDHPTGSGTETEILSKQLEESLFSSLAAKQDTSASNATSANASLSDVRPTQNSQRGEAPRQTQAAPSVSVQPATATTTSAAAAPQASMGSVSLSPTPSADTDAKKDGGVTIDAIEEEMAKLLNEISEPK